MSSDERQQSTAILTLLATLCLWLSHEAAVLFPRLPGAVDLQPWIKIWNQPILVNGPLAVILFAGTVLAGFRFRHRRLRKRRFPPPVQVRDEEYRPIE